MGVVSFIAALFVAAASLGGGSLLWPRLTTSPRPPILQQVHDVVIQTPVGQSAAQTLGVSDETNVAPLDLGSIANEAATGIKDAAQARATTIIMTQVTRQLNSQYEQLPSDQKQVLQQIICQPASSTTSSQGGPASTSGTQIP